MIDIYLVALAFGSRPNHPRWNINTDLNDDGKVDMLDLYYVAINFGEIY